MALSDTDLIRMSHLLDEALALDADAREAWLKALPPEDLDLVPALTKALLSSSGQKSEVEALASIPRLGPGLGVSHESGVKPDDRVGAYRVIRKLGAGGMAEVWLAERADGSFQREVALKLPLQTWQRKDLAQRFARERNILAGLEHTNIGRLYDGGLTAEGLPYLAMEYVPGITLTDWCDQRKLGVRERLQLFLQVLDAVQYAHERQVIHRDLKPSNILVTAAGQVKLLDFGIAKLLTPEDDQRTQITEIYGRALTPSYASPELLKGDEPTAQSDIYSLGVLLYELLTGNRPYQINAKASVAVLEQAIVTTEIKAPSRQINTETALLRAVTQDKLARRLRGDLDAIVMKALAKSAGERYKSASAFAEDLQRHLAGETIEARPNHVVYKLGKLIQRHRQGTALVMATLAVAFVGAAYVLMKSPGWNQTVPNTAAPGPVAVNDKSIAVLPFVDMSEKHDQEYFSDGMSEELIDHLARYTDLKVTARTSSFYFKGKNDDMRTIASKLGVAHLLEGSVRKSGTALRITAQLIRASDGTHLWSQTYDRNLNDIFKVQDDVSESVVRALKVAMDSGGAKRETREPAIEAYNLVLQGDYFFHRGSKGDTEQALKLYERATKVDPDYALAWAKVGSAYSFSVIDGVAKYTRKLRSKALAALATALSLDPNLAYAHTELGGFYHTFDWDWRSAKSEYKRGVELGDTSRGRSGLAAINATETGDCNEQIRVFEDALARSPIGLQNIFSLGRWLQCAERYEESAMMLKRVLELNPKIEGAWASYSLTLELQGKYQEALDAAHMESDEESKIWSLARVYSQLGNYVDAAAYLELYRRRFADQDPYSMARLLAVRGQNVAAFEWIDRAIREHDLGVTDLKIDPDFRKLHNDNRFIEMLVRLKLDDESVAKRQ